MKSIERVTATSQVVNTIKNAIMSKELSIGDKLPSEAELAQEIGVGRSSIREAMRILSAYGIVDVRQGEGTFVVNRVSQQILEFIGFFPSQENMLHLIELRRIIEIGNVLQICNKIGEETTAQLKTYISQMVDYKDREVFKKADRCFHDTLLKKSNNPILSEIVDMLSVMQDRLFNDYSQYDDVIVESIPHHQALLDAILKKDTNACVEAFNRHFNATEEFVRNRYGKESL